MPDCICINNIEKGWSTSDLIALFALLVSISSVLVTSYVNKQIDLIYNKFEKLCLAHIETILKDIENSLVSNTNSLQSITDQLSDLQLYTLYLQKHIYNKIDIKYISGITDKFSDSVYEIHTNTGNTGTAKVDFLEYKLTLINSLYDFAITKELSLYERLINKLNNYGR